MASSVVRSVVVRLIADTSGFDRGINQAGKTTKSLASLLTGGALAAGVALLVNETTKLDTAMRNVNSIAGLTDKALASTTTEIINLSKALPQSAVTLAEGLYDIASSGFQGAEGMTVLNAAASSASAGMTETATSAKAITAVLNAYKLDAGQAADVSDVLFSTVNLGVTSFEQLANNVGDYIGQAQALGVEFAETGSAIATLTLNGTTAAQAGTTLGSVLNTLIKPGAELAKVFKDNGYATGTAAIEALGLRGVLELVRTTTGGTAEGMSELFTDVQALRGALSLTSNEGAVYAEVAGQIEDKSARAGAAQKALEEQSKAAAFQLGLLKNQAVAAGLAAATMVLPSVIDALERIGELGTSAGAGVRELGDALGPTLSNLTEIGQDLWDILNDLGQVAGPTAAGLGKLAVGATVETLELLTDVLAPMVGYLADNEVAALALAIALGIHLAGGVARLAVRIEVALVMALYHGLAAMGAMTAGTAGLGAALTSMAVAAAAATAGVSLALAGVVVGFQRASSAAESLADAQKKTDNAEGITAQIAALRNLGDAAETVLSRTEELRDRSFGMTLVDLPGNIEALRHLSKGTEETAVAAAKAAEQSDVFRTAVNQLAESGFEPGSAAALRFHNDVVLSGKAFDDMLPVLEAAGVKVGDSFETISTKVEAYKASTESAASSSDKVVEALDGIASGAKTTEQAVTDLVAALDALIGVPLDAAKAAVAFEAALDDMQASIAKTSGTLDINTQAGRENVTAIQGSVDALRAKIEADASAGVSAAALSETLVVGRDRLIEQGRAAGIPKAAMEALLAQYNLTPELVQTIVAAVGVQPTRADIVDLTAKANGLNKTVTTNVALSGADAAITKLSAVTQLMDNLSGKTAAPRMNTNLLLPGGLGGPRGDGPGRGGSTLAKVQSMLTPGLRVTSTYRTPAANRAAGGSSTSYHMDRANPAVDVGGSTAALDGLYQRMRAVGGWRELLWRVPGHYDHVHAAAAGGPVWGAGTATSDSIPALLSNGEYVVRASSVSKYGQGLLDAVNEGRLALAAGGPAVRDAGGPLLPGYHIPTTEQDHR